jgi:site-specific recombinase
MTGSPIMPAQPTAWPALRSVLGYFQISQGVAAHADADLAALHALVRRARDNFTWVERVAWLQDAAEWVMDRRARDPAARFAQWLDCVEATPTTRRVVSRLLHSVVVDMQALDFFSSTGLPAEPAFLSEFAARLARRWLPPSAATKDLGALLALLFPTRQSAQWLLAVDTSHLARFARLMQADMPDFAHVVGLFKDMQEAAFTLANQAEALCLHPSLRERLRTVAAGASNGGASPEGAHTNVKLAHLPATRLRDALEMYLQRPDAVAREAVTDWLVATELALTKVSQTLSRGGHARSNQRHAGQHGDGQIHRDANNHIHQAAGVSVGLVYRLEVLQTVLRRLGWLVRCLDTASPLSPKAHAAFVAHAVAAHHAQRSVRGLFTRNTALLARKMVEHNAGRGEHYIARDSAGYRALFKRALGGGVVTACTASLKFAINGLGLPKFVEGCLLALDYAASFVTIQLAGFALATKQPAMTAPALARSMEKLDSRHGARALAREVRCLMRSQAAAVAGNLVAVIPAISTVALAWWWLSGAPMVGADKAWDTVQSLSIAGPTAAFAALTGVLLWLSSLAAGFADNWFALRRMQERLSLNRRLNRWLGETRAHRCAAFLDAHIGGLAANISLGVMLGMVPAIGAFTGLPLDVRHVTLATGAWAASLVSLAPSQGISLALEPDTWRAALGIGAIGLLNVGVSFALAFGLALRAHQAAAGAAGEKRREVLATLWQQGKAKGARYLRQLTNAIPAPTNTAATPNPALMVSLNNSMPNATPNSGVKNENTDKRVAK